MNNVNQRRKIKWLYVLFLILIIIQSANFVIAITHPNQVTQTILGPMGPQGNSGTKGDKGSVGNIGPQGIPGLTGASGLPGENGQNGIPGTNGLNGKDGSNGSNGINGLTPEMICINGYVSWRYTTEASWHPLYAANCNKTSQKISE